MTRFYRRDTSTLIQVRPTSDSEIPFVAFTICPDYYSAYKKDVLAKYNLTVKSYRRDAKWYPELHTKDFSAKDFFRKITFEIFEMIKKIEISTMNLRRPKVVVDVLKGLNKDYLEFDTQYTDTYGRCYTVQVTDNLKSLGITKIKFVTHLGVYIFLDHPGQHLHVNSRSKVFLPKTIYNLSSF